MSQVAYVKSKKKKRACCDCAAVGTTKRCAACWKVHNRDYQRAYGRRRRAKLYATRPPKKCTDCGVDIIGRHRSAVRCFECAKKLDAVNMAAWQKTPAGREYHRRYRRTPEFREKGRAYSRTPKIIAYRKEYYQRPEVIARRKARASTPEAKEASRMAVRKYQAKKKKMNEARSEVEKRRMK